MTKEEIQKHVIRQLELAETSLNAATRFLKELGPKELFNLQVIWVAHQQTQKRLELLRKRFSDND